MSEEDIRFDRLRWGWIALVATSVFGYLAHTGVIRDMWNLEYTEGDDVLRELDLTGVDE
jgi:hypothetical protein